MNSLGPFSFIQLSRPGDRSAPPELVKLGTEIIQRPGVNGTGLMQLGRRGMPFELDGLVDIPTEAGISLAMGQYTAAIGSTLALVWGGIDFEAAFSVNYLVLDVDTLSVRRLAAASGGLNTPTGQFLLTSRWQLCAVEV